MSNENESDIHRPDGILFKGELTGHAKEGQDRRTEIRKPHGIIFPGELIGEVDEQDNVRRPPGIIFRGDAVGQVKGQAAHALDGIIFPGEQWGYVDEEGNVRLRDGVFFKGRIIGKVRGNNVAGALGYFVLRFDRLVQQCDELEGAVSRAKSKADYLSRVRGMLQRVETAEALGDFDSLLRQLRQVERLIEREIDTQRAAKRRLCEGAEALRASENWKQCAETLRHLHLQWKSLASCGRECDEELWQRFQAASQNFHDRRSAHFEARERERARSRARKEQFCREAEKLSESSDWKYAGDALKGLMGEWKRAGHAGREIDDALWARFRAAGDRFHTRREAYFAERNREIERNLEHLCGIAGRAASLVGSSDYRAATERIKELQAEWRSVGFVPRERSQEVWASFRESCDRVFEDARDARERKQAEWRAGQHEALDRFRDKEQSLTASIDHDLGLIDHWEDVIANLHDGPRADEIEAAMREKISSVSEKVESKRDRLREIEEIIEDIERRLN